MRYFLYLAYDGTAYHGWQIQPNAVSVQEQLQRALSTGMQTPVEVVGAGRTDTGVHAQMMMAHFDSEEEIADTEQLIWKLNRLLPADISVYGILPVHPVAHARFSALSRTYRYYLHQDRRVFGRQYSWRVSALLDFEAMNEAAARLLSYSDFTSFSKSRTDTRTNDCKITSARWEQVDSHSWQFEITANRFLRNMVRAIVGTLVEVGRGNLSLAGFEEIIRRKDRCLAGESVPAHALFLTQIVYPAECFVDDKTYARFKGIFPPNPMDCP